MTKERRVQNITGFIEIRLPKEIVCGSESRPCYSTYVITMSGGREQRNINWSQPRMRFILARGIHTTKQIDILLNFFHACKGMAYGFRFKDPSDYFAKHQMIGVGNAQFISFQLVKRYSTSDDDIACGDESTITDRITVRKITKPVKDSVQIYFMNANDESLKLAKHEDYSVDCTTGIVTFVNAPVDGVKIFASFEFDVPVRFDTDHLPIITEGKNVYICSDVPLIELK